MTHYRPQANHASVMYADKECWDQCQTVMLDGRDCLNAGVALSSQHVSILEASVTELENPTQELKLSVAICVLMVHSVSHVKQKHGLKVAGGPAGRALAELKAPSIESARATKQLLQSESSL